MASIRFCLPRNFVVRKSVPLLCCCESEMKENIVLFLCSIEVPYRTIQYTLMITIDGGK
jgi:hypothetical protein